MSSSLIITSIASPNKALNALARGCKENDSEMIVIGDTKSPKDFLIKNCRFISVKEQRRLRMPLAKLLPLNHYARKNVGYLLSKEKDFIIETDDDNIPYSNFWKLKKTLTKITEIKTKGWINIYSHFTDKIIWPRGFPVAKIQEVGRKSQKFILSKRASGNFPIIQSLTDKNPDVDAIHRIRFPGEINFSKNKSLQLGKGAWCPFNSQNTRWQKEAFPLMYLPSYCSFRMTDIWRSFVAQRIAWECGWKILFRSPTVIHERNEHNLWKDFNDEIPGYLLNESICKGLEDLDLKRGRKNLIENLLRSYKFMVKKKWTSHKELKLLDAWCKEF